MVFSEGVCGRMRKTVDILNLVPSGPDWQILWKEIEDAAALLDCICAVLYS